jgi:hypothetical protein
MGVGNERHKDKRNLHVRLAMRRQLFWVAERYFQAGCIRSPLFFGCQR